MADVVLGLAPVFLVIALGHVLRSAGFPGEAFWEPLERLVYFLLFPALLVVSMATAQIQPGALAPALGAVIAATLTVAGALAASHRLTGLPGPALAAVFQGAIRFNTYVGLAAAGTLFGREGVAALAILLAVMIPVSNVLSVLALARFADGGTPPGWRAILAEMARNPLILASVLGLALNLSGIGLPMPAGPALRILGEASLALGLLAVGAGLDPGTLRAAGAPVAISAALKLAVLPALTAALCQALGASPLAAGVALLFAALPPAPSAYILTRRMGGDHALMAGIITVHTVLAAITMPLVMTVLS